MGSYSISTLRPPFPLPLLCTDRAASDRVRLDDSQFLSRSQASAYSSILLCNSGSWFSLPSLTAKTESGLRAKEESRNVCEVGYECDLHSATVLYRGSQAVGGCSQRRLRLSPGLPREPLLPQLGQLLLQVARVSWWLHLLNSKGQLGIEKGEQREREDEPA